ncbi:hypothetical protein C0Q70_18616 [Pomacea canaliculata]|uniref:MORN repeat-containing protein 1 n=1 Tax=Pomacea canaliculata TaxID=400727 RepID=A0A2T7NH13_POMCA|nr:hypothetical protein C0Q70_18616 [Pomacea canaliculata]
MATDEERRESYVGEKRMFLRDGYGVYVYENQFFRYEGEWQKGKKHGHGKLIMKDGTYYEGQFVNGEISGHGFKFFASSKCKYTGEFLNGELNGHGIMHYSDNTIYEGQWQKNKKQGFGILRTSPKAVYKGHFQNHLRNGEGSQTYDNGDQYQGYWVRDKRHGHGELLCNDGTLYVGQFADDKFHGEGRMQHISGMSYMGQWHYGFPSHLATRLVLIADESPLMIEKDQTFNIRVQCQDDDGNVIVEDEGREIQVSAGFKYYPPKEGAVLFDMIEDVEEHPISTPFGYDVVSYPLTDQPIEDQQERKGDKAAKEEDGDDKEGEADEGDMDDPDKERRSEHKPSMESVDNIAGSSHSELFKAKIPQDSSSIVKESEIYSLPPPVATQRTVKGEVQWSSLRLGPPPPMYRPFIAMEEERKKNKKSLKEKPSETDADDGVEKNVESKELIKEVEISKPKTEKEGVSKGKVKDKKMCPNSPRSDKRKKDMCEVSERKIKIEESAVEIIEEQTIEIFCETLT